MCKYCSRTSPLYTILDRTKNLMTLLTSIEHNYDNTNRYSIHTIFASIPIILLWSSNNIFLIIAIVRQKFVTCEWIYPIILLQKAPLCVFIFYLSFYFSYWILHLIMRSRKYYAIFSFYKFSLIVCIYVIISENNI